jgi:ParB family chromosome partitioning protein
MATELLHIPLDKIIEPDEKLRAVDKETEEYEGLVDSIKAKGVLNPINVRELKDPESGEEIYGLVDGLQRYTASKDAGKESIPAQVISCDEGELIETQILANVHKIETKPVEYSKALLKLLQNNPLLTRSELAAKLCKTTAWISERLGLLKLVDQVGKLVDDDKIGLSNAYALARLPQEEQADYVDRAIAMPPPQFGATVNARVKEIRQAKREGRDAAPAEFQPIAILRSRKELMEEMEAGEQGGLLVSNNKPSTPDEAFALAVKWALNLDPASIEIQKAKDEERKAELKRRKEENALERKRRRAKEAAEKAAQLQEEAKEVEKELAPS